MSESKKLNLFTALSSIQYLQYYALMELLLFPTEHPCPNVWELVPGPMRPKKESIGPELQCAVYRWLTTEAGAWTSRKAQRSLRFGLEDRWVIKQGKGYFRTRHGGASLRSSGTTWVDSISTLPFPLRSDFTCQTIHSLSQATIRLESGTFLSQVLVIKLHTPLSWFCLFYALWKGWLRGNSYSYHSRWFQ